VVLLPVGGGGPDTELQSRRSALCAVCHVVVSATAILRLPCRKNDFAIE
jgi:hypothetical protein